MDELHESVFRMLLASMMENSSRNMERVGDLATNIAEDAVFLAEGKQIKHHLEHSG